MHRTKQVGIWSEMGSFWQPQPTQDQPAPPEEFEIDSRIGAAAPRAPAASKENSRPQAILKFQPRNSFDYRVRYEPQHIVSLIQLLKFTQLKKMLSKAHNFEMFFFCEWLYFKVRLQFFLGLVKSEGRRGYHSIK